MSDAYKWFYENYDTFFFKYLSFKNSLMISSFSTFHCKPGDNSAMCLMVLRMYTYINIILILYIYYFYVYNKHYTYCIL